MDLNFICTYYFFFLIVLYLNYLPHDMPLYWNQMCSLTAYWHRNPIGVIESPGVVRLRNGKEYRVWGGGGPIATLCHCGRESRGVTHRGHTKDNTGEKIEQQRKGLKTRRGTMTRAAGKYRECNVYVCVCSVGGVDWNLGNFHNNCTSVYKKKCRSRTQHISLKSNSYT